MPQCQFSVFFCFWFQKWQKINIPQIGRDKSQSQYFTVGNMEPEDETEEGLEGDTPPGRAARPGPCLGGAAASGTPSTSLFAYKKPPIPKPSGPDQIMTRVAISLSCKVK